MEFIFQGESDLVEPKQEENRVSSSLLEVAEAMIEMANHDSRERKKPRWKEMELEQSSSEMMVAMRNDMYEIRTFGWRNGPFFCHVKIKTY